MSVLKLLILEIILKMNKLCQIHDFDDVHVKTITICLQPLFVFGFYYILSKIWFEKQDRSKDCHSRKYVHENSSIIDKEFQLNFKSTRNLTI